LLSAETIDQDALAHILGPRAEGKEEADREAITQEG
jgi:hypothetical protein